jgi:mannose-6-phosphate isomerase-like protein (cupin superfamily)
VTPRVILPSEGRALGTPSGAGVLVKLGSAETGGALTVFETTRARGDERWPRPHRHVQMDETFFVVEGGYVFELDGDEHDAPAGTVVFLPRGTRHRFRSRGEVPGRILTFATPGGIESFFEEAARPDANIELAFRTNGFAFDP